MLYRNATTWVALAPGTSGYSLQSQGASANLQWAQTSLTAGVTGTLPVANGGTGTATGSITGTGALTFAAGGSNTNVVLTPQGTGSTILNGSVGIGTTTTVAGGGLTIAPAAVATGTPSLLTVTGPADTTLTASTEATDVNFNLARTVQFATGAITNQRAVRFQAPTYGFVGASTITNAATVSISGPPVAGTNATLTNTAALIVESGKVGIGTTAPSQALEVNGTIRATDIILTSDARAKHNIESLDIVKALNKITQVRPVSFSWNTTGLSDEGVIAQEIEKIFPELVIHNPDGTLSVKYPSLIAPMIGSIQELNIRNQRLQQRNDDLERRVQSLEERLDKVLKRMGGE